MFNLVAWESSNHAFLVPWLCYLFLIVGHCLLWEVCPLTASQKSHQVRMWSNTLDTGILIIISCLSLIGSKRCPLSIATATLSNYFRRKLRGRKLCVSEGNCRNLTLPCLASLGGWVYMNQYLCFITKYSSFETALFSLLLIVLCTRQSRKWGNFPWFHFEILPARIESPNKFSVCSKNFTHSLTFIQSKVETVCTTIEQDATPLWEEENIIISSTVELLTLLWSWQQHH